MPTGSHDVSSWRQTGRGEGRSSLPPLDPKAQATKKAPAPAGEGWSRRLLGIFRALCRGGPVLSKNLYNSNPSILVCYVSPRI